MNSGRLLSVFLLSAFVAACAGGKCRCDLSIMQDNERNCAWLGSGDGWAFIADVGGFQACLRNGKSADEVPDVIIVHGVAVRVDWETGEPMWTLGGHYILELIPFPEAFKGDKAREAGRQLVIDENTMEVHAVFDGYDALSYPYDPTKYVAYDTKGSLLIIDGDGKLSLRLRYTGSKEREDSPRKTIETLQKTPPGAPSTFEENPIELIAGFVAFFAIIVVMVFSLAQLCVPHSYSSSDFDCCRGFWMPGLRR